MSQWGKARRPASRAAGVIGAAAVLAVTACSAAVPASLSAPRPSQTALSPAQLVALTRAVPCARGRTASPPAQLASFHAVTAVSCIQLPRELPHAGQWLVDVRRVATSGAAALQTAFELAPTQPAGNVTCAGVAVATPNVSLVDGDGRVLVPTAPRDACGEPSAAVLSAYRAAGWLEVAVKKVRLIVSARAEADGCDMRWKNENWLATEFGVHVSRGGPVFMQQPRVVHACVYRVVGRDLEVGDFQRGFDLSRRRTATLVTALERPGPSHACPPQREFAVISAESGQTANVELGGCWRVQRPYPDNGIGAADPVVVHDLLMAGPVW